MMMRAPTLATLAVAVSALLFVLSSSTTWAQSSAPPAAPPPTPAPATPAPPAPTTPAPATPAPTPAAPSDASKVDDAFIVDCVAAVVNKSVVLHSEIEVMLEQYMKAEPPAATQDPLKLRAARRDEILDTLIAEKLLDEEVRKLRIDVTAAEVDRVVRGTMQDNGLDEEKLKAALARQGLTLDEYKEGLKKQLTKMKIVQLKVKSRVNVDDQQVKAAAKQREALDASEFRVRARHILVLVPPGSSADVDAAARSKIMQAQARVTKGEDFATVAKEMSDDPGSKDHGGSLGEFGRGEMVPEFERAAFNAEPGKVVGPVRTTFGWHIIKVDERIGVKAKSADQALKDIRDKLYALEVENQFRAYLDELRRNAHVDKRATCS